MRIVTTVLRVRIVLRIFRNRIAISGLPVNAQGTEVQEPTYTLPSGSDEEVLCSIDSVALEILPSSVRSHPGRAMVYDLYTFERGGERSLIRQVADDNIQSELFQFRCSHALPSQYPSTHSV